ncbi:MAG TPA: ATP-binding protein, partial [Blastocatellia bacterium]|nr:ATP-binding protein [Blastocatellia bacterium]
VRFEDRLEVEFKVEPGILTAAVPSFMVQPILENAIKYAIAPSESAGHIDIRALRRGPSLVLEISDSGCIVEGKRVERQPAKEGVGLSNTRARLEQLYGSGQRFRISDEDGGGLRVTIEIPYTPQPSSASAAALT